MDDLEDKINIRTLMVSFGKEDFPKFLDVLYADNYAHGMITSKKRLENIIKAEKYFEENKASFCFSKSNLNISANDLIDLSIEKSFLSSVINKLFHAVIYETCENSKESLIKYAKNIINTEKQR